MKNILLIPRIKIHNANALSSPYTIGFPAMTAWLGAVHALERKLKAAGFSDLQFKSTGVVCHKIDLQTYKGSGDYVHSIIGTGNPLDKSGKRPSFIEEARCHLDVSLIIEFTYKGFDEDELLQAVDHLLEGHMKIAGGDIISSSSPELHDDRDAGRQRKLIRKLMPGYCLIERRDLMLQAMEEGLDGIDAMLEYIKVTHYCQIDKNEKVNWISSRKEKGWIIPIATGFQGITEPGFAENQRDPDTPHRFAESIVTLGEFVMPHRISDLDNILWHYHADLENNLYLCKQNKHINNKQGEL